jgi:hypothetical protein
VAAQPVPVAVLAHRACTRHPDAPAAAADYLAGLVRQARPGADPAAVAAELACAAETELITANTLAAAARRIDPDCAQVPDPL